MSDNRVFAVEQILYGSFVKKDRLKTLVLETFSNTSIGSATELNIFVDLYSILHSIFSEHYRTDITDYTAVTSSMVNFCAHYRSFFRMLGVHTTFYFVYSNNCCALNRKFVAEYNNKYLEKVNIPVFRDMVNTNLDLLKILCPYLPDIHIITSDYNYEVGVVMANLIEKLNDGKPNMIISRDIIPIQLTYLYPNTSYLYPLKSSKNGDQSMMIPINEKVEYRYKFWSLVSHVLHCNVAKVSDISPINYPLFLAASKCPHRNLTAICTCLQSAKMIRNVVGSADVRVIPEQLLNSPILNGYPIAPIYARMRALDITLQLPYFRNSPESTNLDFSNLKDDGTIHTINSQFFANNPLDLQRL